MIPDFSKSLDDCHEAIKHAYPICAEQFQRDFLGMSLKLDYTYRSKHLQFDLYKKGRELQNGIWVVVDKTQVVTQKDGSTPSHHGVYPSQAADIYIKQSNSIIWPDEKKPEICAIYKAMGRLFDLQGLVSGANWKFAGWKDYPHIQVAYEIV